MEEFIQLIEQVMSLPEDENLETNLQTYENLFNALENNQELINDLKKQYRLMGTDIDQITTEKEDFLHAINASLANDERLTLKKKELITKFLITVSKMFDKVATDLNRETVNIAYEICRPNAKEPTYAHSHDAGFDFYLPEDFTIKAHEYGKIAPTGLKMSIPSGYELQIRPRSGNSVKTTLRISNAPGTIDSAYCDEIGIICDNIGDKDLTFKKGDRIAQGVLSAVPKGVFLKVEDITKIAGSNRKGGFGSTGK
jgi:dUTP pyrophosphatase